MQNMKVVVLGANRYSFDDEKTGRTVEGCKVHYISLDNSTGDNEIGSIPMSQSMEYSFFNKIGQVPGIYEAVTALDMRGKKLGIKIVDFKFIDPVTFEMPVKA